MSQLICAVNFLLTFNPMGFPDLRKQKIAYAANDWGYGHVLRSVGIIRRLVALQNEVIIACDPSQQVLFETYFPQLTYVPLPGYALRFSGKGNWAGDLWQQREAFRAAISAEKNCLAQLHTEHCFDLILSDHRYGFYHPEVRSVFITHQLQLPLAWYQAPVQWWHEKQLRHFNQLWVPDTATCTLSGKLGAAIRHADIRYIGWQSRFDAPADQPPHYEQLLILSGPDPYAELLFHEFLDKKLVHSDHPAVIYPAHLALPRHLLKADYFPASDMHLADKIFMASEQILSRSGYSTLMDLKITGKKGLLIPTPGQAEQQYLAQHLANDLQFTFVI